MSSKKRVCVVGAGPCGMAALCHFAEMDIKDRPEVVCYEKQSTWGGLWNLSWLTGTDEKGERCHSGMYKHLWTNAPKECLEFPDYTFDEHFSGKPTPSFPPRVVLRDYLEGRWNKSSKDHQKCIRFNTVVRSVVYNDSTDDFTVIATNLETNVSTTETFSYVIVAVGIFNVPNKPSFEGIDSFNGRILHAHDFRDASEFKGQRLLLVGASYSAEDLALQCMKFGAKSIVCTWRSKAMGFKFPAGVEERPLLQKLSGNTAHFKDGSKAEVDALILCTGYLYSFPFMEDRLRLQSPLSLYPEGVYKGTLWMGGGNNKVFYLGIQDHYFTFTMFESQALWACRYIVGKITGEPKSESEMKKDATQWVTRCKGLTDCHSDIDFQADFIQDISEQVNYPPNATLARAMFHQWEKDKVENVVTYRDKCFKSVFTGTTAPRNSTVWWKAFDDTAEAFKNNK